MTDPTSPDRIDELLALAVLGELSTDEAAELDAALAADLASSEDLAADLAIAAELQSAHSEPPPVDLKARVLAAIDDVEQDQPSVVDDPGARTTPGRLAPPTEQPAAPVVDDLTERRAARRARRWQPLAAAAAVVLFIAGGLIVANRAGDGDTRLDEIAQADDAVTRTLTGELDGTLDVVYSVRERALVLDGEEIPALESSVTYQLWVIDEAGVRPVGTFEPDESGRVAERFDVDPSDVTFGVTIEPAGGSEQPTLPIVAQA